MCGGYNCRVLVSIFFEKLNTYSPLNCRKFGEFLENFESNPGGVKTCKNAYLGHLCTKELVTVLNFFKEIQKTEHFFMHVIFIIFTVVQNYNFTGVPYFLD